MNASETSNPNYFHKVVDCQWACPAHTNVPEYIRLIAQGRYTDAYMVNRESNVFPAVLPWESATGDRESFFRRGQSDTAARNHVASKLSRRESEVISSEGT